MSNRMLAGEWPECETPESVQRVARRRAVVVEVVGAVVVFAAVFAVEPVARVVASAMGVAA